MRGIPPLLAVLALVPCLSGQEEKAAPFSLEAPFAVAAHRVVDLDGDGIDELVIVGVAGEVRVHRATRDGGRAALSEGVGIALPDPSHALVAIAPVLDGKAPCLVVIDRKGARAHRFEGDGFVAEPVRLTPTARFELRTGRPTFSDVARDGNGDGMIDLVVPAADGVSLWLRRGASEGGEPVFERTATVKTREETDVDRDGDTLRHALMIPDLDTLDVNGDGRPDLVVSQRKRTEIFLQKKDGTLPEAPDAVLDLDVFRDTTGSATVRPGYTLAGTETARSLIRDIDDDGIPDYLVAHRRKVWIFHGSKDGPQFQHPTQILKTADDLTAIWLADLDRDRDLDLLILRVQVPTIGALLTGLLGSIKIDFAAFGYANEGGRKLATQPSWKRELRFVLPSLSEILRNPEKLIRRFEEAGRTFRRSVETDLDGDGALDVVLVSQDEKRLEIWMGDPERPAPPEDELDDILRRVLFEDAQDTWDVDRIIAWIESMGSARAERLTAGRAPDRSLAARDHEHLALAAVEPLRAPPGALILCVYAPLDGSPRRLFELHPTPPN